LICLLLESTHPQLHTSEQWELVDYCIVSAYQNSRCYASMHARERCGAFLPAESRAPTGKSAHWNPMLLRRRSHPPRTRFSDEYIQPIVPGPMHSAVITTQICIPLVCAVQPKSSDPSLSLGARSSLYRDSVSVVDRHGILPVLETGVLKGEIARSTTMLTMLRIESMPRPSCRSYIERADALYKMLWPAHL
jgi:hypothetical protein